MDEHTTWRGNSSRVLSFTPSVNRHPFPPVFMVLAHLGPGSAVRLAAAHGVIAECKQGLERHVTGVGLSLCTRRTCPGYPAGGQDTCEQSRGPGIPARATQPVYRHAGEPAKTSEARGDHTSRRCLLLDL